MSSNSNGEASLTVDPMVESFTAWAKKLLLPELVLLEKAYLVDRYNFGHLLHSEITARIYSRNVPESTSGKRPSSTAKAKS